MRGLIVARSFPWIGIDSPEDDWRARGDALAAIGAPGEFRPAPVGAGEAAALHSRRTVHHV
jgi:hypothetical protein